jgi:hypothetical protein
MQRECSANAAPWLVCVLANTVWPVQKTIRVIHKYYIEPKLVATAGGISTCFGLACSD